MKVGFCKKYLVQKGVCVKAGKFVCVEAGVCKTLEAKQKRVKLVDASGIAVRVHVEKAVSAEEEQEWQVRTEAAG